MNQKPSPYRKLLSAAAKIAILAAILWWVHDTLLDGWVELAERDRGQWRWQPGWLAVAGGIYLLGLAPFGLFWRRVLRDLGQDARVGETLRAYYIGHLGKYVPGKAMVVVVRTALIRGPRVSTPVAAASVFFETLTMMAVGAFAAAAYLAIARRDQPAWILAAAILMVLSLTPTIPPVFRQIARLTRIDRTDPLVGQRLAKLGVSTLLVGWLLSLLGWTLLGLSYWATLRAMGIGGLDPLRDLPCFTAAVALAVVAGFLLLVLPAGVGVREAFLAKLVGAELTKLGQPGPNSTAWASAFVLRLVWTLSELAISSMMYWMRARKPRP